jgi:hypothetical protein
LCGRKRKEGKSRAKNGSGRVERTERAGRETEKLLDRRVFLLEQGVEPLSAVDNSRGIETERGQLTKDKF